MISSLRGTVLEASGSTVVVEVGGIGLSVNVTANHAMSLRIGAEATLRTALIVREDDLSLYGFADSGELAVFDLLRGVSGVGPKSALGVLGELNANEVAIAVNAEDDAAFRRVSGIGPKTAKLIVVSLAGKVFPNSNATVARTAVASSVSENVIVALVGLGWPERVATQAVEDASAAASESDRQTVSSLLRLALAELGPQKAAGVVR